MEIGGFGISGSAPKMSERKPSRHAAAKVSAPGVKVLSFCMFALIWARFWSFWHRKRWRWSRFFQLIWHSHLLIQKPARAPRTELAPARSELAPARSELAPSTVTEKLGEPHILNAKKVQNRRAIQEMCLKFWQNISNLTKILILN